MHNANEILYYKIFTFTNKSMSNSQSETVKHVQVAL